MNRSSVLATNTAGWRNAHLVTPRLRAIMWAVGRRVIGYLKRYLPGEMACTPVAFATAWIVTSLGESAAITALAVTWAEIIAFYTVIIVRDLRASCRTSHGGLLITLRNAFVEFGPAELLDGLLIRPAALYAGMTLMPHMALGIVVGKFVADICFYVPTVIAYELRLRLLPSNLE